MTQSVSGDALLHDVTALRGLAVRLVDDPLLADDLLQATTVRALEHRGPLITRPRAWLSRVMTNLARDQRRRHVRRESREQAVAARESTRSTEELVAELDVRVFLLRAVRSLKAPYRDVVLLRFFEGLPPRAISERLGVPVKTVDTRLRRALDQLRARLDERSAGDRSQWVASLVAFVRPENHAVAASAASIAGAFAMKLVLVTAGGVALAAVATLAWLLNDSTPGLPESARETVTAPPETPISAPSPGEPTEMSRAEHEPRSTQPAATEQPVVRGRVFLATGEPAMAGIELSVQPDRAAAASVAVSVKTDGDGRFEVPVERDWPRYRVTCVDPRFAPVMDGQADVEASRDAVIVVAGATTVTGIVVGPGGVPVAGASIGLEVPETLRARFDVDLSATTSCSFTARSRADGAFEIRRAPEIVGSVVDAYKVGYESASERLDVVPFRRIELTLQRSGVAVLEGIVYGTDGAPMPDVRVALGADPATTDELGRFRFEYDPASPADRVTAVALGRLPATRDREGPSWPPFIELRLDREPLALAGVVLDRHGDPIDGAMVWIDEPTLLASWNDRFWISENIISGRSGLQHETQTDADGRFRLDSLVDREYGLFAMVPELVWRVDAGRFVAGDERIVIRFPDHGLHDRLEGIVVDGQDAPVEGVTVQTSIEMVAARDPVSGMVYMNGATGTSTTSDENGRFVLADVPIDARLSIAGQGVDSFQEVEVPDELAGPLTIRVSRRCELRVDRPAGAAAAVEFELRDADGEVVATRRREVGRVVQLERAPLQDGRSEVLTASDAAVELVLFDAGGQIVARLPIRLDPGERTIIR